MEKEILQDAAGLGVVVSLISVAVLWGVVLGG